MEAIAVDLAEVWSEPAGRKTPSVYIRTLAWGDHVEVVERTAHHVKVRTVEFVEKPDGSILPKVIEGYIRPARNSGVKPSGVTVPTSESAVLKVNFVDVQQGDGTVIETPEGKVVLLDGGDNQLFARYLAGRFRGTAAAEPKEVDCIVVTHGDADHFEGLTEIYESETNPTPRKRLFIHPQRVYHNGLVKRPGKGPDKKRTPDLKLLGETQMKDGAHYVVGLEDDLLAVPDAAMNTPFRAWKRTLKAYRKRGPIAFRRLAFGDDDAFAFLRVGDPGRDGRLRMDVLGPLVEGVGGRPGLRFLGHPPKGPRIGYVGGDEREFDGHSASHTINGHSIILRLQYGNVRYLFAGDLNEEAERELTGHHADRLRAEVFKVPHHGSADFAPDFLQAVAPVISVVSSGDESARKEYIHPRANLVGALGRHARVREPLVFVTEMVAFFEVVGYVDPEAHEMKGGVAVVEGGVAKLNARAKERFFAFRRTAFGIVKTRTDGERLLVYTDSGNVKMKEAYAFTVQANGNVEPARVQKV